MHHLIDGSEPAAPYFPQILQILRRKIIHSPVKLQFARRVDRLAYLEPTIPKQKRTIYICQNKRKQKQSQNMTDSQNK